MFRKSKMRDDNERAPFKPAKGTAPLNNNRVLTEKQPAICKTKASAEIIS